MKIFIWEGNGISEAYHDDGTLVVLAETPEQARQIVRDLVNEHKTKYKNTSSPYFDGTMEALNREPDRVKELDKPQWIAFNGGGYD